MPEIGPEHPLTYRQEIAAPLFRLVQAGDSGAIIGPASMGKSRLLQFILRPDVQQHYLGEQGGSTLLVLVDCNRLARISEWGLYELLLTSLTEATGRHPLSQPVREELNQLRREVILSENALLARRHTELALHVLCEERGLKVGLILDEFDECYCTLPAVALTNLRAMRDANKYRLSYLLVMREQPGRLRASTDCEGFYELLSRAVLGLGPYSLADAARMTQQLEVRKNRPLAATERAELWRLSGGHPGLLVALFDGLDRLPVQGAVAQQTDEEKAIREALAQAAVREECQKLWLGLAEDERLALSRLAQGVALDSAAADGLGLKGVIQARGRQEFFSPIFARFVATMAAPATRSLWVDEAARVVWVEQRCISNLTVSEFDLLAFLYDHLGRVCTRDEILAELHPEEYRETRGHAPFPLRGSRSGSDTRSAGDKETRGRKEGSAGAMDMLLQQTKEKGLQDNRVDTLIKRVRAKIEPIPQRPHYLLSIRGKGYKLIDMPEGNG